MCRLQVFGACLDDLAREHGDALQVLVPAKSRCIDSVRAKKLPVIRHVLVGVADDGS
jgi:hypothetical protein